MEIIECLACKVIASECHVIVMYDASCDAPRNATKLFFSNLNYNFEYSNFGQVNTKKNSVTSRVTEVCVL